MHVEESRYFNPSTDTDGITMELRFYTIGPDAIAYLDEHAPEWRNKVTAHSFSRRVEFHVSVMEHLSPIDIIEHIKHARFSIAMDLAREITKNLEPISARYASPLKVKR